jgi:hypothetical protein
MLDDILCREFSVLLAEFPQSVILLEYHFEQLFIYSTSVLKLHVINLLTIYTCIYVPTLIL